MKTTNILSLELICTIWYIITDISTGGKNIVIDALHFNSHTLPTVEYFN